MTYEEREFANNLVEYLNEAVRLAANNTGARYIDVSSAFYDSGRDYRLCGNQDITAVNGLITDYGFENTEPRSTKRPEDPAYYESYHPNVLGHVLLAGQIRAMTNDFSAPMQDPPSTQASRVGDDFRIKLVGYKESVYDSEMHIKQDVMNRIEQLSSGTSVQFQTDPSLPPAPNMKAQIYVHSNPVLLKEVPINSSGVTLATVNFPSDLSLGPHEIHVYYTSMSGQKVDIYQYITVVHSLEDYDGDGVLDSQEKCMLVPASGVDSDHDGIDDACDGEYVIRRSGESEAQAVIQQANMDSATWSEEINAAVDLIAGKSISYSYTPGSVNSSNTKYDGDIMAGEEKGSSYETNVETLSNPGFVIVICLSIILPIMVFTYKVVRRKYAKKANN